MAFRGEIMKINLENQPLPKIYKRCGKECYLDSIREKLIFITPEETVRQKAISYLIDELQTPRSMITVEEHISHYVANSKRRADIVIHKLNDIDNTSSPIAVVECKAKGVLLGEKAVNQVLDYADFLECEYAMLTDGEDTICCKFDSESNQYIDIKALPNYQDMIKGIYSKIEEDETPIRIPFEDLEKNLCDYQDYEIGTNTTLSKAIPIMNLWECLLDVSYKFPKNKYKLFNLLEDYGIRFLSYGNAGGGIFSGPYRSFLIDVNGSTEFVSINISTYVTEAKQEIQKTSLNVAIDNEKDTHHSLQLILDDNLTVIGNSCYFYHHGRIGIGNLGSGKVSELRKLVYARYPQIVDGKRFFLGKLEHDRLWHLDDQEIVTLIENLISYALLRDEYRNSYKAAKKKTNIKD